jgi:hypothetical protein
MNLTELIDSIDWYSYARFLCIIAFVGYAVFMQHSRFIGFLGMAACSFLFLNWVHLTVFAYDSWQWIAVYMVLCVGLVSALTIIGNLWLLLLFVLFVFIIGGVIILLYV